MPKRNTNMSSKQKKKKPVYKFDMIKVLKERLALKEKNPAYYEKLRNIKLVVPAELNNTNVGIELPSVLPTLEEHAITDFSNYNIRFNDITDLKQSCLQRLRVLSIEQNEVKAIIHFNILMKANWSPVLKDFENILQGWHPDFVSTTNNESLKHKTKGYQRVDLHNFKLVLRFIDYCILKKSCELNDNDLLTLAKFMVNMFFDPSCRPGINAIKKLFSICIEIALNKAKDTIKQFAQELYLNRPVENLLDMVTDLFLPIEGCVTKTIYSYLSYTLFKSLLGKSNNNMMEFSTDINDWRVRARFGG